MEKTDLAVLDDIYETILERKRNPRNDSYVCSLLNHEKGFDRILEKIVEESAETIIAAKNGRTDEIVYESCDLLFHLMIMLAEKDIKLNQLIDELKNRQ
ncbi:phosphoribosyl-ATP diphosphatase [Methanosalsum natronophilum]|uniref:Phosphoribosyl-ATP pyrophosphatase n=1 Tax=Methanosalsum natronophilum TaxID=768733 RepID=A0A424YRD9_9EURY|nr:phosphoribosyl-ATP diphosphatase [Methanosalsum natronophilum]MCS3923994.1 phosphoribosyl-ATP pyrophosphohydrolase [Methanosalsum natronophilum]RQD81342.1 MAG: phosphoribosyl-ATP diphosphatase [Methanosalsum natronophilum]